MALQVRSSFGALVVSVIIADESPARRSAHGTRLVEREGRPPSPLPHMT
ncbi:hypothetical protein [Frigoribacterium sp. PhB24]|nr:hypothetical protein [Frigoribacterium sp. PhB24]